VILTAHGTKVNRTEPNRKRVWPVKITPLDSVVRALEFKFLALLLTTKPVSPVFASKQTSCLHFNS